MIMFTIFYENSNHINVFNIFIIVWKKPETIYYYYLSTVFLLIMVIKFISEFIFLSLSIAGPIHFLPSYLFLAATFGADALHGGGLLDIECESMPSGMTGHLSMIAISEEDRKRLGMVHFIHETMAARKKVIEILR